MLVSVIEAANQEPCYLFSIGEAAERKKKSWSGLPEYGLEKNRMIEDGMKEEGEYH